MPRWLQIVLHAFLAGLNAVLAFHGVIAPEVVLGVSTVQAVLGTVSQSFNTDGTPQEVPYRKPE